MAGFRKYKGDGSTAYLRPLNRLGETGRYLAPPRVVSAVNTAYHLGLPLLVTGDPGVGKTTLAWSVASELGLGDVLELHIRSDHQARDILYEIDHLRRFYDAQIHNPDATKIQAYVRLREFGFAIKEASEGRRRVVLIDEIDKAPRDFPNDLLDPMDMMSFTIEETGDRYAAKPDCRPFVILTSNKERDLPDAFLRRCVYCNIPFPGKEGLRNILRQRLESELTGVDDRLLNLTIDRFLKLAERLERKPASGELVQWLKVLKLAGVDLSTLPERVEDLPFQEVLVKTLKDVNMIESVQAGHR